MASKLKVDLKQWLKSPQVENLSKHLTTYEKRAKELVKELELKSRDAREKSREQLARFTTQVRKTGIEVEKNVKDLLAQEGKVLNQKLNELVTYVKGLANNEKKAAPVAAAAPAKPARKASGAKKTSGAARPKRTTKKASAPAHAPQA